MKYRHWHLALLLMSSFAAQAQCPSNKGQLELAASQGYMTANQLSDQLSANDNAATGRGGKTQTYSSGATFVTARYFLFNRLAFGITGGVTNERGQYTDRYNPSFIASVYRRNITTIAPELYYIYFFRKYIEVYTLFGIGPSFISTVTTVTPTPYTPGATNTERHDALKLQYTPIGIRFGGRIGGFVEVGIGYKGIINAGASFKLGPSCWWRS